MVSPSERKTDEVNYDVANALIQLRTESSSTDVRTTLQSTNTVNPPTVPPHRTTQLSPTELPHPHSFPQAYQNPLQPVLVLSTQRYTVNFSTGIVEPKERENMSDDDSISDSAWDEVCREVDFSNGSFCGDFSVSETWEGIGFDNDDGSMLNLPRVPPHIRIFQASTSTVMPKEEDSAWDEVCREVDFSNGSSCGGDSDRVGWKGQSLGDNDGSMSTSTKEGNETEEVFIQLQDNDFNKESISLSAEEDNDSFFEREEFFIQLQEDDFNNIT